MPIDPYQDDPAWTCVKRGPKGNNVYVNAINGPDKDITPDHLSASFEKRSRLWRQSSARKELLGMLKRNEPEGGWGIDRAVCLALGSCSTLNLESNTRSLLQFACFLDLARELGGEGGVELYAQDPILQPVDKAFLRGKAVTVLECSDDALDGLADAKRHLGPSSLLCEFFMDMSGQGVEDIMNAGSGIYIGSSFRRHESERIMAGQSEGTRMCVERFLEGRVQRRFPEFGEGGNVFRGLCVYWAVEGEGDEEDDEGETEGG